MQIDNSIAQTPRQPPPCVAYKTFMSFLNGLRQVPTRVDRRTIDPLSRGVQSRLLSTLRYLKAKALCHNIRVLIRCMYELNVELDFSDLPPIPEDESGQGKLALDRINYIPGINRN